MAKIDFLSQYVPSADQANVLNGTSTADYTAELNAAFSTPAPAYGLNLLILPPGVLWQSDRIYINTNALVVEAKGCQLMFKASGSGNESIYAEGWNNWSITGLRVNGNSANRPGATEGHGIYIGNCERFTLRDCEFVLSPAADGISMGSDNGTQVNRARIGLLDNIKTEQNGRNGISIAGAYDINLVNCQAKNNYANAPQTGFACEPVPGTTNENINFYGCSSQYNLGDGVYFSGTNNGCNIFGGRYQHNQRHGISKGGNNIGINGVLSLGNNTAGDIGP